MKSYICKSCQAPFESKKGCKSRQPQYCSSICYGKKMQITVNCKQCGSKVENKHSSSISNRIYCSRKCQGDARKGVMLSTEWKKALSEGRKKSEKCKGQNLYNWKGGKTTESIRVKQSFYKRKKMLSQDMPIYFLNKMLVAQKNKCFFCESLLTEYKAIEHLTPVSRGGDNQKFNLVYSCKSCNSSKRQNTLEEYAIKKNNPYWIKKWENFYIETL